MIDVYKKYFQKSFTFLFPLLGFRVPSMHPIQTYIAWKDIIKFDDRKLICLFQKRPDNEWLNFEKDFLISNYMFEFCEIIDDKILYVFDFHQFSEDFDNFSQGKYSLISDKSKKMILSFYQESSLNREYVDSYLYPEMYYKLYSEFLDVDIKLLQSVGELCDKFNEEKETCNLNLVTI